MYLVGHAAIGIVFASGIHDPVAAFGVGWLSHYVADFVPHGDEAAGEWAKRGHEVKRILLLVAIDGAILACAYGWFVAHRGWSWSAAAAAAGSFVPDVLWGLEKVFKRPLIGPLERFHHLNHNFFHVRIPVVLGLVLQAILAGSLWSWLTLG